jgi:CHRD domain
MLVESNEEGTMGLEEAFQRKLKSLGAPGNRKRRAKPAMMLHLAVAALATVLLLATGSAAFATTLALKATLSGGGEAPPNDATGRAELNATLDTTTNTLTWTASYSGLTGAPIGAHFHGPVSYIGLTSEENAPIQVGTPGSLASPFKGSTTITDVQAKDLKDGRWYFNIHTPKFPAGEVRGPIFRQ